MENSTKAGIKLFKNSLVSSGRAAPRCVSNGSLKAAGDDNFIVLFLRICRAEYVSVYLYMLGKAIIELIDRYTSAAVRVPAQMPATQRGAPDRCPRGGFRASAACAHDTRRRGTASR